MTPTRFTSCALVLAWTAVLSGLLYWNVSQKNHEMESGLLQNGRSYFGFLVLGRAWNALHGGVYLRESDKIQINPYLPEGERGLETASGETLVRVNPAFMTRLLSEMSAPKDGVLFHITSLRPVRPENRAQEWEVQALREFEHGKEEVFLWDQVDATRVFRYMAPLVVTEACMPCHAPHGYSVGDVRGGISITIPADRAVSLVRQGIWNLCWGFFMIWGIGTLGILVGMRRVEQEVLRADVANRSKSEFLATMSHEIRNAMNGVLGMLYLAQNTDLAEEKREYLDAAGNSGKVLLGIVNDVVDFSRIEAGRLEIVPQCFEPGRLLEEVVAAHKPALHAKSVRLVGIVDPSVPKWLSCDAIRLRQILNNLCGNAVKFTDRGEITIRLDLKDGRWLRGEVRDTGAGISGERLQKLFRPYEQAGSGLRGAERGSGLGLSIVRRLTELMQGGVEMESVAGKGTVVRFTVAVSIPDRAAESCTDRPETGIEIRAAARAMKILVAEDDAVNRLVVSKLLQKLGDEVVCVENGRKAVEIVQAGGIDLVLMDVGMPVMDGVTATRTIRGMEDPELSSIPIVGLSANAMTGDRERFLAEGMDDYLTKPIEVDALVKVIAGCRRQKGAAQG